MKRLRKFVVPEDTQAERSCLTWPGLPFQQPYGERSWHSYHKNLKIWTPEAEKNCGNHPKI